MKNPENFQSDPIIIDYAEKIRFEYTGNYSGQIRFNHRIIRRIDDVVGIPSKCLVIKDGIEKQEKIDIAVVGSRAQMIVHQKPSAEVEINDNEVILRINHRVLDGKVQDQQREQSPKTQSLSYEDLFSIGLNVVLAHGMHAWAQEEAEQYPFFQRIHKKRQLKKMFLEEQNNIARIIPAASKGQGEVA